MSQKHLDLVSSHDLSEDALEYDRKPKVNLPGIDVCLAPRLRCLRVPPGAIYRTISMALSSQCSLSLSSIPPFLLSPLNIPRSSLRIAIFLAIGDFQTGSREAQ